MNEIFIVRLFKKKKKKIWLKAYFFQGAGAGAGEKIPGAGQKWTGSATLLITLSTP